MPAHRNHGTSYEAPRRSRRLSHMGPKTYDEDGFETIDLDLESRRYSSEASDASYSPPTPSYPDSVHPYHRGSSSPHRTHTRKASDEHIPRPPNSFMLYRSHYWEVQKHAPEERDHRAISRLAAASWNILSDDEKAIWKALAAQRKAEHARKYPEYRYAPNGARRRRSKKVPRNNQREVRRCERVFDMIKRGQNLDNGVPQLSSPSPEPTPSPSTPPPVSPVEVKIESPQFTFDTLPEPPRAVSPVFPTASTFVSPSSLQPVESLDFNQFVQFEGELVYPDDFVPTEHIPTIDLSAPPSCSYPSLKQESPSSSRSHSPVLPADRDIDQHFGCKPEIYNLEPQQTLCTASNGFPEVSSFGYGEEAIYPLYDAPQPSLVLPLFDFMGSATYQLQQPPSSNYSGLNVQLGSMALDDNLLQALEQNDYSY